MLEAHKIKWLLAADNAEQHLLLLGQILPPSLSLLKKCLTGVETRLQFGRQYRLIIIMYKSKSRLA
jgi:hypothetical protein